ncbi:conserved hypothetical protein [Brucella sp. NVSL 07-0026]|nr:conserved hypothetical protein [Brucella sp. NVSL 07-0026]
MRVTDTQQYSEPHRVCRRPQLVRSRVYDKQDDKQVFPEVPARAVRIVAAHEAEHRSRWAAVSSIAVKIGCSTGNLS